MDRPTLQALKVRRTDIKARWTRLLHLERANTALANPDTLAFLIDETLRVVFAALESDNLPERDTPPCCSCGRNPYLGYFAAGKQALLEVLIEVQREHPRLTSAQRDADLKSVVNALCVVIGDYADSFATLCLHRTSACAEGASVTAATANQPAFAIKS